ncbi:hypothetical protein [uncultured Erythrobacter sp.]|uniref:hypothetical protein n=1 Tax=uncultured Erythrobacter sp. TaxID=263913 RepID=UPI00260EFCE4|nr:hypothetical protein [uncultured Erythrobacter sp.]
MSVGATIAPLEARYSLIKLLGWMGLLVPILAISGYWLLEAAQAGMSLNFAAALIACLLIAGIFASFLRLMFDRRVQLRIDQAGIYVRSHHTSAIPLRSLVGIHETSGRIIFGIVKPERFPIQSQWRRFLIRINSQSARQYFGDLWIWTSLLDCTANDVYNAIHDFRVPTDFEMEMRARGASARSDLVPHRK